MSQIVPDLMPNLEGCLQQGTLVEISSNASQNPFLKSCLLFKGPEFWYNMTTIWMILWGPAP